MPPSLKSPTSETSNGFPARAERIGRARRYLGVLFVVILWCSEAALAATIRRAGGEPVDGRPEGLLVMKGYTNGDQGKKILTYFMVNGSEVQEAGAKALTVMRDGLLLQCTSLSDSLAPAAVLGRVLTRPPAKGFKLLGTPGDHRELKRHEDEDLMNAWPFPGPEGTVFCFFGSVKAVIDGELLGELLSGPAPSRARLVPAVRVRTAKGLVSIPVSGLAP